MKVVISLLANQLYYIQCIIHLRSPLLKVGFFSDKYHTLKLIEKMEVERSNKSTQESHSVPLHSEGAQTHTYSPLKQGDDQNIISSLLGNVIVGALHQYKISMVLSGVGYTMKVLDKILYIHVNKRPIQLQIPQDIQLLVKNETELQASSHNLQLLTQFVHSICQLKPSYKDKYKAKGFLSPVLLK
jgi:ribosomal protein L6P/L9E